MPEELRHEPAEAELTVARAGVDRIWVSHGRCGVRDQQRLAGITAEEILRGNVARGVIAFSKHEASFGNRQHESGSGRVGSARCRAQQRHERNRQGGERTGVARRVRDRKPTAL